MTSTTTILTEAELLAERDRLRAENERLHAACAEMRETIEVIGSQNHNLECPNCRVCEAVDKALSSDAGRDYRHKGDYKPLTEALSLSLDEHRQVLGFLTARVANQEPVTAWRSDTADLIERLEKTLAHARTKGLL